MQRLLPSIGRSLKVGRQGPCQHGRHVVAVSLLQHEAAPPAAPAAAPAAAAAAEDARRGARGGRGGGGVRRAGGVSGGGHVAAAVVVQQGAPDAALAAQAPLHEEGRPPDRRPVGGRTEVQLGAGGGLGTVGILGVTTVAAGLEGAARACTHSSASTVDTPVRLHQ